jgi:hypothetical protein
MTISPILLYVWGALFFSFLSLLVYRGQLTRYEQEQLFLEDEELQIVQRNKQEKEHILHRLNRIKPFLGTVGVAAGLVTTTVVGMYVYNAWQNIPKNW